MPYVERPVRVRDQASPQAYVAAYIEHLKVKNYAPQSIAYRQMALLLFVDWLQERGIERLNDVTRPMLERYAQHLHYALDRRGKVLSVQTQANRLTAVRRVFRWLVQQNHLLYNPASELELPKREKRLPKEVLTAEEAEQVLSQPEVNTSEGLMHRAVLEVLYSTGIRRMELINLEVQDMSFSRGVLAVRQGKGRKDRFVPIGERALVWARKYLDDVRPERALPRSPGNLFLDPEGQALDPHRISRAVQKYVEQAQVGKHGRCHLFRHTMATLMLENGADIRFIQQMLGHAMLSTTEIYTHVAIVKLKEIHTATHPARLKGALLELAHRSHAAEPTPTADDVLLALAAEAEEEEDQDAG